MIYEGTHTWAFTMKYGYTWTSSVTDTLTDHEETMIITYFSKKDPAHIHQTRKKSGMTAEVAIQTLIAVVNTSGFFFMRF